MTYLFLGFYFSVKFCRILKLLCFRVCVGDINGILFPVVFFPLCSECFQFASHLTKSIFCSFPRHGLFFSNARSSRLCVNVMLFTLFVLCSKQVNCVSSYSHFPVHFQIMFFFFCLFVCLFFQMSAAPYQAVRSCYDFYCLIFTTFKKGTIWKPT